MAIGTLSYVTSRIVPLLFVVVSCTGGSPLPADDRAVGAPPEELTWEECLGEPAVSRFGDPGGNGRQTLGVGYIPRAATGEDRERAFLTIDRFDIAEVVDASGQRIDSIHVEGHALKGRLNTAGPVVEGRSWIGARFLGLLECTSRAHRGQKIRVRARIDDAVRHRGDGSTGKGLENAWTYRLMLELKDGGETSWTPACNGSDDRVIPVRGFFQRDGSYDADRELLSFACTKKGAAKCENLGYVPDGASDSDGLGSDKFAACVRMMRADYCGRGVSFTTDGLDVLVWDEASPPVMTDGKKFEAAWTRDGAACIHHARWAPLPDDLADAWTACRVEFDAANRWCSSDKEARDKSKTSGGPKPVLFNGSFVPGQAATLTPRSGLHRP